MSSLAAEPSAANDELLSLGAGSSVELDSTGAGSPSPPTLTSFDAPPTTSHMSTSHDTPLEAALGPVLVISGGSGYNDLVNATPGATYVMPISDNGGSSSEIIRVLGGPSIGDLRSRLTRLIPTPSRHLSSTSSPPPPPSNEAIHNLLSYRLPSHSRSREIKQEWLDILEGRHPLWRGIEPERKEVIRGFLVHFESEVLRRAHRHFNFRGGSIGNFFLAAAQMFFRSIQSAIFLFAATTQMQSTGQSKVLPVINTNHTATIAAELEDGEVVVGQCEISHPAPKSGGKVVGGQQQQQALLSVDAVQGLSDGGPSTPGFGPTAHYHVEPFTESRYTSIKSSADIFSSEASRLAEAKSELSGPSPLSVQRIDDRAAAPASARKGLTTVGNQKDGLDPEHDDDQDSQDDTPDSPHISSPLPRRERTGNIIFTKAEESSEPALPSPIKRILYVNAYRNEIYPAPNPSFVSALGSSKTLIYSCGSLYTSIVPCLCLRSIATSIAASPTLRYKVLLLNSVQDRETMGMDAVGFVRAICDALNQSDNHGARAWQPNELVSHLVFFKHGQVKVDSKRLQDEMGIKCVEVESRLTSKNGMPKFDEDCVREALRKITL